MWRPLAHLVCLLVIIVSTFWLTPNVTLAQGLVPSCPAGATSCPEAYHPDNYGACEVVVLANNLISFFIGLIAVVGSIVMVYAGYLLVTSRGNVSQMEKAKSMFTNVLIGVVIMLSAFLIVNTVLGVLVGTDSPILNWNEIKCQYANQAGTPVKGNIVAGLHPNGILSDQEYEIIVSNINPNLLYQTAAACSDGNIQKIWSGLAAQASCIIQHESACGSLPISRSDLGVDGNPFSFGAMQVNTTVHVIRGCQHLAIPDLNCNEAWSGKDYGARVVNQTLYQQCRNALLNNECNMINGRRIYQEAGNSWQPWSTAGSCGLR